MTSTGPASGAEPAVPPGFPDAQGSAEVDESSISAISRDEHPLLEKLQRKAFRLSVFDSIKLEYPEIVQKLIDLKYNAVQIERAYLFHEDRKGLYALQNAHETVFTAFARSSFLCKQLIEILCAKSGNGVKDLHAISEYWRPLKNFDYTDKQLGRVLVHQGAQGIVNLHLVHIVTSSAFSDQELPDYRQDMAKMACDHKDVLALNVIAQRWRNLEGVGYAEEQLKKVLVCKGPLGLASLDRVHRAMSPAVTETELSARRTMLAGMACSDAGLKLLDRIFHVRKALEEFGYTVEQLDGVFNRHEFPGLEALRLASNSMSIRFPNYDPGFPYAQLLDVAYKDDGVDTLRVLSQVHGLMLSVLNDAELPAVRNVLSRIGMDGDGAEKLGAILAYLNASPRVKSIDETLGLAARPNDAELLLTKIDQIRAERQKGQT